MQNKIYIVLVFIGDLEIILGISADRFDLMGVVMELAPGCPKFLFEL